MTKKIVLITLVALVLLIVKILYQAGVFKTIVNHSDLKNISLYTNVTGTEDLDIDRENALLFISSSDRWNIDSTSASKDGIYLLNLNSVGAKQNKPVRLATTLAEEFHPHGIYFLKKDNKDYLFAVNHNKKGNFVEVFQYQNNQLTHLKSYKNDQMCCPNDVLAVDVDKFYVTNDHGAAKGFARTLEDYLQLANSYVLYFDGNSFSKVLEGVVYANGINVSKDGKTVYVTEVSGGKIYVMDRDIESGQLSERFNQDLDTGADNISIDIDGNLWIGSHPQLLAFVGHAKNTGRYAPSQVLMLTHNGASKFDVKEIYLNDGKQISASSVAVRYKDDVYVGVVFESKLLKGTLTKALH